MTKHPKQFTFWPLLPLGFLAVFLLFLTLFSRWGIRMNTFMSMFAISGLFGLTMVAFSLELVKSLKWEDIWKPFTICIGLCVVSFVSGWLLELNQPDLASE